MIACAHGSVRLVGEVVDNLILFCICPNLSCLVFVIIRVYICAILCASKFKKQHYTWFPAEVFLYNRYEGEQYTFNNTTVACGVHADL